MRVTGVHVLLVGGCHREDVPNLRGCPTLGPQLQDVELLELQVLDRPAVLEQQTLPLETLLGQSAVVAEIL